MPEQQSDLLFWAQMRSNVVQKTRVAFGNRLSAIERGVDQATENDLKLLEAFYGRFAEMESELNELVVELTEGIPIVDAMINIKGIGRLTAAKIVSTIDISRAPHVSSLWRYAGFGVRPDGTRDRLVKGEKACFNKYLKKECYLMSVSFMRSSSPYRSIYDAAKEYYQTNREDWTPLHIENAAKRKMIKDFLQHLWLVWRNMEGLKISKPYVEEKLGHTHISKPQDFGWPEELCEFSYD